MSSCAPTRTSQVSPPSLLHGAGGGREKEGEGEKKEAPILWKSPPRRKRGGEEVGEGMPFLPHYTAVIYSSSPVLFSGIKTGCKFDS